MDEFTIVVETPGGSRVKYKWDPDNQCMTVKKLLPEGMLFPYDFGFIPATKGQDGDPVDALIISEFSSFPGCRVPCRLIGGLLAHQIEGKKKVRNDRFFFVPLSSYMFSKVKSMRQLPKEIMEQLTDFFINYNRAEDKQFKPVRTIDAMTAWNMLKKQKHE